MPILKAYFAKLAHPDSSLLKKSIKTALYSLQSNISQYPYLSLEKKKKKKLLFEHHKTRKALFSLHLVSGFWLKTR